MTLTLSSAARLCSAATAGAWLNSWVDTSPGIEWGLLGVSLVLIAAVVWLDTFTKHERGKHGPDTH